MLKDPKTLLTNSRICLVFKLLFVPLQACFLHFAENVKRL